ncbi:MAG: hypothetical protein IPO04_16020 [Cytophagaceae bacterium]|nr:hypothetical protein [Cytophagaceae bacterium]
MKRILLMVAILISNIAFSQEFEVISQSTKDCNCKENGRLISTGYSNTSGSLHQNGANDNDWKITSYPNGTGTINTIVKIQDFHCGQQLRILNNGLCQPLAPSFHQIQINCLLQGLTLKTEYMFILTP